MKLWSSRIKAYQRIGPHQHIILEIIFGTLLGDSHIERKSYNTKNGIKLGSTRISFQQENNNVEYLMWLWKIFMEYGYCTIKKPNLKTKIGYKGKIIRYYKLHTFTFSSFNWIHDLFYPDGKNKVIPPKEEIHKFLTPLALACWIMDDGSKIQNTLKISTNSFCYSDIEMITKVLLEKYDLKTSIHSAGVPNQYIIYIKKCSMKKLKKLVEPYFVKSMLYKLGK